MKFYNPFKPHIVKFRNGKFAIRRAGFPFGFWEYLDKFTLDFWWSIPQYVANNAFFSSKEEAQTRFDVYKQAPRDNGVPV